MIKMVNKPFDKNLHRKHDPRSRQIVKDFFAKLDIPLKDHPDKFDADLMTEDELYLVEVEHRVVWKKTKFPFPTIHIPRRKDKFFKEGKVHYVILSNDYRMLGFLSAQKAKKYMKDKHLVEVENRFVAKDEYFYDVPTREFEFYPVK